MAGWGWETMYQVVKAINAGSQWHGQLRRLMKVVWELNLTWKLKLMSQRSTVLRAEYPVSELRLGTEGRDVRPLLLTTDQRGQAVKGRVEESVKNMTKSSGFAKMLIRT